MPPGHLLLLNPETASRVELRTVASKLQEDRADARFTRVLGPQLTELTLASPARALEALTVRSDELLAQGYLLLDEGDRRQLHRQLAHLSPWKEWIEIERNPKRLVDWWASWGAPPALVEKFLSTVTSVDATPSALCLQCDSLEYECSLPLQPDALARVPRLLRAFMCVHAKIENEDSSFAAGWYPSDDAAQFDIYDLGISENAFFFLTSSAGLAFLADERIELLEWEEAMRIVPTTVGRMIMNALVSA